MSAQIWVFSEQPALLAELTGAARGVAGGVEVTALVLGARENAQQAIQRGADRAVWLGELAPGQMVDDFVPTLHELIIARKPALVLIGSTRRGKAVAGRLAARLGVSALTDALDLEFKDGAIHARHMIFGGGALRTDRVSAQPAVVTITPGTFDALPADALPADAARSGEIEAAVFIEPPWRVKLVERQPLPKASVHLDHARKVVAVGRGLAKQEDLALVERLAALLGAEVACTRPLAEGLGWLPVERYIGISGATIKPDLYLGIGVSGQVQHMIGMFGSKVVAAVNKDEHAPIFSQADYGVAADLYSLLPALIAALERR